MQITEEQVIGWIGQILRSEVEEHEDGQHLVFQSRRNQSPHTVLKVDPELTEALERLAAKKLKDETVIYDEHSYEVLVEPATPAWRRQTFFLPEGYFLHDPTNDLTYVLGASSIEYLLFVLKEASERDALRSSLLYRSRRPDRITARQMSGIEESGSQALVDLVRKLSPRLLTLRVSSNRAIGTAEFENFANAFLFQIGYNLNEAIVSRRFLDDLLRREGIAGGRRSRFEDVEPPRRGYQEDLVHHYLLATASSSPSLRFLSYYHVAEHFFEAVFRDDLIESVRQIITQPGFSHRRKKDIDRVINKVTSSLKQSDDRELFSEQQALRLTLEKYIPEPQDLVEQIQAYDESLLGYYKDHEVSFSSGDKVDLEDSDTQRLYSALSKRIYKTRNAIVHSKDGVRGRYIPYKHDRELAREIPMIRSVAELIIVASSTLL